MIRLNTEEALSGDRASSDVTLTRVRLQGTIDRTEGITDPRSDQADERDHKDCHEHEDDCILRESLPPFLWIE